jgi:hypothetical protein
MWQEGVRPIVVMEFLSPSTRDEDLGRTQRRGKQPTKWEVYEQVLGIPYYIVFDRYTDELQGFQLEGDRYKKLELNEPKVWIPSLGMGLGLWRGEYRGCDRQWLRWYDAAGNWIPTEAEQERQEKELARARAERLAERLREAGIDPEQI